MTEKRRIAIVTGGRPDYGLFLPLLTVLAKDQAVDLQVIATGMHLVSEQGETWRQIERDGFHIAAKVDLKLAGDSPLVISHAIANGTAGMADAFDHLRPDIVVLLGDRFESLAAATAAMIARIPVAHLHGGEATEGLIDEPIRHSITKMAHLHFTATDAYRRRVIQLGEPPERVFCVGAIGLDNFRNMTLLDRPALEEALSFSLGDPTFLATYHPVTLEAGSSAAHADAFLAALDAFPDARIVITLPNADTDSAALRDRFQRYADSSGGRVVAYAALGSLRYLSLMSQCDVVVGNSSSGLLEAPSVPVPTVDIGDRQQGRIAPASVIHVEPDAASIVAGIRRALDPAFRAGLVGMRNPYGDGGTAPRIAEILTSVPLDGTLIKKRFFDFRQACIE
jgi:UDP-hydrolysing UDP-N-acetyl-D-glucosamine 2-epimerase